MTLSAGPRFVVATGSVTGAEHARLSRDGQDGFAVKADHASVVAVVTDGCSSGAFSEVGARLGAGWIATACARRFQEGADVVAAARGVHADVVRGLRALAGSSTRPLRDPVEFVSDYLLFTFLAAVVDEDSFVVFGVGDGGFAVNGRSTAIDSGPDNAPPYAAYALLTGLAAPELVIHARGRTEDLASLVLATDGANGLIGDAEPVGELVPERLVRNPSLLKKTLVRARAERPLLDDATCVAIARRAS